MTSEITGKQAIQQSENISLGSLLGMTSYNKTHKIQMEKLAGHKR